MIYKLSVLLVSFGLGLSLQAADPIWLINFNGEGEGEAPPALGKTDSSEVSVSGDFERAEDANPARLKIVTSDGPDGGMALELTGGDVQNGAGYKTSKRGQSLEGNEITYEALIKPAEMPEPFNKSWGGQQIINQQPGGSIPQFWLSYNDQGSVSLGSTAAKGIMGLVTPGKWSHVAGVITLAAEEGGDSTMKLYINGDLVQETSFKRPAGKLPQSLALGRYMQDSKGDAFQGQIDAIAVSPVALEPSGFQLPLPQ